MTLLEMVVAIALLSVGVVGVVASFATLQRTAMVKQDQAQLEVAIRQLSDFVRMSDTNRLPTDGLRYKQCAAPDGSSYAAGLTADVNAVPPIITPPSDSNGRPLVTWDITAVYVTERGTYHGPSAALMQCSAGEDWGVQEVRVTASSTSRHASLTRLVWKGAA